MRRWSKRASKRRVSPKRKPSRSRYWPLIAGLAAAAVGWAVYSGLTSGAADQVRRYRIEVVRSFQHDPAAFTQGLVFHEGKLYESTGRRGESSLRRIDARTGQIEEMRRLPSRYFGEGLARVGERLYQITWEEETAFVWDLETLRETERLHYSGEGWGLCHDGSRLIMSDGSDTLVFRDPGTFRETGRVRVRMGERPVRELNELECVGTRVYANVWQRNVILEIDPDSGQVVGQVDALGLLAGGEALGADVLNGIAYDPSSRTYYLTGKLWPKFFEVRFVPVE